MHVLFQIIIAALSVLGFYLCLKTLASLIFTSRQVAATVIIENAQQLDDLDLLLPDAEAALFTARRRLAVIVSLEVWRACDNKEKHRVKEIADAFGAKLYFFSAMDS